VVGDDPGRSDKFDIDQNHAARQAYLSRSRPSRGDIPPEPWHRIGAVSRAGLCRQHGMQHRPKRESIKTKVVLLVHLTGVAQRGELYLLPHWPNYSLSPQPRLLRHRSRARRTASGPGMTEAEVRQREKKPQALRRTQEASLRTVQILHPPPSSPWREPVSLKSYMSCNACYECCQHCIGRGERLVRGYAVTDDVVKSNAWIDGCSFD
jgi:hypothetical protein